MTISQLVTCIRSKGFTAGEFFVIINYFIHKKIENITEKDINQVLHMWKKALKAREKWLKDRDVLDEGNDAPEWLLPFLL